MPERSPRYVEVRQFIAQERRRLRDETIRPWFGFGSGRFEGMTASKQRLAFENLAFDGSARRIYWEHFDPFFQVFIRRCIDEATHLADEDGHPRGPTLRETAALLRTTIESLYNEIDRLDAILRSRHGTPAERISPSVKERVQTLREFIGEMAAARIAGLPHLPKDLAKEDANYRDVQAFGKHIHTDRLRKAHQRGTIRRIPKAGTKNRYLYSAADARKLWPGLVPD